MPSPQPGHSPRSVRVWDLPTRAFHWLLVALVTISMYTGNVGGVAEMEWHMRAGYAVLALVLFRLAWGVVGSRHSRFADFVRGPRAVLGYARDLVRGLSPRVLGHNPLGGWSVVAMLTSLLLQAVTGLFANDDILTKGPLAKHVSKAMSDRLTGIHDLNATVLYVLIAVHLGAVFSYLVLKKENLIRPMLSGRKRVEPGEIPGAGGEDEPFASPWWAIPIVGAAAAAVWFVVTR